MLTFLAQSPTTQQAIETAVSAKANEWWAPVFTALVLGSVAVVGAAAALVIAWLKAKTAVVEARAKAEVLAAEAAATAKSAAQTAQANSERLTTTNRKLDAMQNTLTQVALHTPPPTGTSNAPFHLLSDDEAEKPTGLTGQNVNPVTGSPRIDPLSGSSLDRPKGT